jgi:hypothetical protein
MSLDTVLQPPPKGVVQKSAFNPHACAVQNYNIVEDLAQEPSVMLSLEVLQTCRAQWKEMLKAIGGIDPTDTNLIIFDLEHVVVICLGMLLPRRSSEKGTFGLLYLTTA